jgi:hypothetical protein
MSVGLESASAGVAMMMPFGPANATVWLRELKFVPAISISALGAPAIGVTDVTVGVPRSVTIELPAIPVSRTLAAFTEIVVVLAAVAGAAYTPLDVIVPTVAFPPTTPLTIHSTAESKFPVPFTLALKLICWPDHVVAPCGETVTELGLTDSDGGDAVSPAALPPAQLAPESEASTHAIKIHLPGRLNRAKFQCRWGSTEGPHFHGEPFTKRVLGDRQMLSQKVVLSPSR